MKKKLLKNVFLGTWGRNAKAKPPAFGAEGRWHQGATIKIYGNIWPLVGGKMGIDWGNRLCKGATLD